MDPSPLPPMHTGTCAQTHAHRRTVIRTYARECRVYTHAYARARTHTHIHMRTFTFAYTHVHIHTYTHVHIRTYTQGQRLLIMENTNESQNRPQGADGLGFHALCLDNWSHFPLPLTPPLSHSRTRALFLLGADIDQTVQTMCIEGVLSL